MNKLTLSDIELQIPGAHWSGDELRGGCPLCGNSTSFAATENGGKLKLYCHHCEAKFENFRQHFKAGATTDRTPTPKRPPSKPKPTHAEAAATAQKELDQTQPANPKQNYLQKKNVKPYRIRQTLKGDLFIPLRNIYGELTTRQEITPAGDKYLLKGGSKKGSFFILDDDEINPSEKVHIGEGFSTCASVKEAVGGVVVMAVDAGNLIPVASSIRERYPEAEIVICGDDDRFPKETGDTYEQAPQ